MGATIDARLPFGSTIVGGIALAVVVAAPFSFLTVLAWRGDPSGGLVAVGCGVVLIGWLLVELAFIREFSFFHPLFGLVGIGFVDAGRRVAAATVR